MSVETVERVPVQFRVTGETRDRIDRKARELGISRSAYIRAQILRDLGLPLEAHRYRANTTAQRANTTAQRASDGK